MGPSLWPASLSHDQHNQERQRCNHEDYPRALVALVEIEPGAYAKNERYQRAGHPGEACAFSDEKAHALVVLPQNMPDIAL